jgi:hypothetical protein
MSRTLHSSLRHVDTAIHHAEVLAEEAESLGAHDVARKLAALAQELALDLAEASELLDRVEPAREARSLAHRSLQSVYDDVTSQIEDKGCPETLARLTPAGYLDVVERSRYRVRRLAEADEPELLRIRDHTERALLAYETCVDAYLLTASEAQVKRDAVVAKSQLLRLTLERTKRHLLTLAPVGSPQWSRIKRRAVRTKRPRWLTRDAALGPLPPTSALSPRKERASERPLRAAA